MLTVEELAEKELRTIFVGNLPVECIEKVRYRDKNMFAIDILIRCFRRVTSNWKLDLKNVERSSRFVSDQ